MAKMVPSEISDEIKSDAERKIFKWLKEAQNTEDWVVLHSLGISNHKKLIYGEVDFVILAPKLGIFVIEVKGGGVRRDEGVWIFTDRYNREHKKNRSPYEQAKEGMFSLLSVVDNRLGKNNKFTNFIHGFGVAFPDINFTTNDPEIEPWQIFDKSFNKDIVGYIKKLAYNTKNRWIETHGYISENKTPNVKDIRDYLQILRSDFDLYVPFYTIIDRTEDRLINLTQEQYNLIDSWEDNSRLLVQGGAGTGKTLLAIEEAKKESRNGKKVALFCFNNLLGEWLRCYFDKCESNERPFYVGTFHSFLLKNIKDQNLTLPNELDNEFFQSDIFELALDSIIKSEVCYDKIIIDEAQDLLERKYLDLIDLIIQGGLRSGKWTMYGDLSMQSIYNSISADNMLKLLDDYSIFSKYKLTKNCRNTKQIADEIKYITGYEYSSNVNNVDGLPVYYYSYSNINNLEEKLESNIQRLLREGIKESQITILSPRKFQDSIINNLKTIKFEPYSTEGNKQLSFCTIHSYKGLENSVIILTDIENYDDLQLLYVGISRARSMLIVFESNKSANQRNELMIKRYLK